MASTTASAAAGSKDGNANATGAAPANTFYQLYRRSSIGMSLTDALDELIESGHIAPHLARKVVEEVGV
jgi:transcription initiation factor TFIIA small subunit